MLLKLGFRMMRELSFRQQFKIGYNLCWKGVWAVEVFKRRIKRGEFFPAFLFFSLTNNCNLRCQGCWVTPTKPVQQMSLETVDRIIEAGKAKGAHFYGLLGGEPMLHDGLLDILAKHSDCYFQLFTNGTLITEELAQQMRVLGNVTPLVSIEGLEAVSDERRGGDDVYARTLEGLRNCKKAGLFTGIATSICKSNFNDLVRDEFVEQVAELGAHYLWYYIYRPVGPRPTPELVLDEEEILRLRKFMVELRSRAPIAIVDAYWNDKGEALCPAATGISHHINPAGDVEPCPVVQFAKENVNRCEDLTQAIQGSKFLSDFRALVQDTTQGCILMDNPQALLGFLKENDIEDTSGRNQAYNELEAMIKRPGHHLPGQEIPEKSWLYRFAKKNWFFGFGAYG
ncbi:radical SAM protein [bacterium M21]|nr:radical SAM protein [bacterium M21]